MGLHGAAAQASTTRLVAATVTLVWSASGEPALAGAGRGVDGLVDHLAAQVLLATARGQWQRLKACGNDECRVAFWDASRNGGARFCSSALCGNRVRQRAFRERTRATPTQSGSGGRQPDG